MIDILIPVLGRPGNAQPLAHSINSATTVAHHIHWLASPYDEDQHHACEQAGGTLWIMPFLPGPGDYAKKMNIAFRDLDAEYLFLAADDLDFKPGWDTAALAIADQHGVVATNDLANASVRRGQFGTHNLVKRTYIELCGGSADGPGIIFHEGYDHNFVDRELCALAQHRRQYAFARNSHVQHRHPLWKTAPDDATYQKGLKHFHRDRMLFYRRAAQHGFAGRLTPQERRLARSR